MRTSHGDVLESRRRRFLPGVVGLAGLILLAMGAGNPAQAASTAQPASTPNTAALPIALCTSIEQAYLLQHPWRHDLHVNGSDCTTTRGVVRRITSTTAVRTMGISLTAISSCQGYWVPQNITAWGLVQMGYLQVAIGACYDGTSVWRSWGPICKIVLWAPVTRGWPYVCGSYQGNGGLVAYGGFDAQLWEPVIGWCCDKYFWEQFTILPNGYWF